MSNLIGQLAGNILPYCMDGYCTVRVVMDTSECKKKCSVYQGSFCMSTGIASCQLQTVLTTSR